MLKCNYQGLEFEIDPIPIFFETAGRLNFFKKRNLLGRLNGPITLVSSNLYALESGTIFHTQEGEFRAAPLLKPNPDGSVNLVQSGFSVTGVWDVFGQLEIAQNLGSLKKNFTVTYDADPNLDKQSNLICFGSPSSNLLSLEACQYLESVLADYFHWGEGWNSFNLGEEEYISGDEGIVIFYESPWNENYKILLLSGIGPMGTLGCCKIVSNWSKYLVTRRQKKSNSFISVIKYNPDLGQRPIVKKFIELST